MVSTKCNHYQRIQCYYGDRFNQFCVSLGLVCVCLSLAHAFSCVIMSKPFFTTLLRFHRFYRFALIRFTFCRGSLDSVFVKEINVGTLDIVIAILMLLRNSKTLLENGEQGKGNRKQGTGNRERRTGNREQGTENKEQNTGNRKEGTGNEEWGTGTVLDCTRKKKLTESYKIRQSVFIAPFYGKLQEITPV